MNAKKCIFQDRTIKHLPAKGMKLVLDMVWQDDSVTLSGDLQHPIGEKDILGDDIKIHLTRRQFPDLSPFRPKNNLAGGCHLAPEPDEDPITDVRQTR